MIWQSLKHLEQALVDVGLVPKNCRLLDIVVAPMAQTIIRYEVFVDRDDLLKLATAFATAAAPHTKEPTEEP